MISKKEELDMSRWGLGGSMPEGDRSTWTIGKEKDMTMAIGDDRSATGTNDPWVHRSKHMRCQTCMFYVTKAPEETTAPPVNVLGRCRRHAPTMGGYPAVFVTDWCGDHKVDENKL